MEDLVKKKEQSILPVDQLLQHVEQKETMVKNQKQVKKVKKEKFNEKFITQISKFIK